MNVFISYSTDDLALVREIAEYIKPHSKVHYWDASKRLGEVAWKTIFGWIDGSDIVLTLITDSTVSRAMAVGQEVGHAKAKGKLIIPIVSSEVQPSQLGCLHEVTYQHIDRNNPGPALQSLEKVILGRKKQVETQQTLLLLGGVLLAVWLSSGK